MLVLSRKRLESVVVGGAVGFEPLLKVTVLELKGGSVRLGFEVDSSVPVHRLEVGNGSAPPGSRTVLCKTPRHRWSDEDPGCRTMIGSPDAKFAHHAQPVSKDSMIMLRLAAVSFAIALIAALFGFGSVFSFSWEGSRILFFIFAVLAVMCLVGAAYRKRELLN